MLNNNKVKLTEMTTTKTVTRPDYSAIDRSNKALQVIGVNASDSKWTFVTDCRPIVERMNTPVKVCGKNVRIYMGNTYLMNDTGLKKYNLK